MFTAIVIDHLSQIQLASLARANGLIPANSQIRLHHCTLSMGIRKGAEIGRARMLTVTHWGEIAGRVTAFRVAGAEDSANAVPHITIATANGAKPRESNDIADWVPLDEPLTVWGEIKMCES